MKTEVLAILDRSGSMQSVRDEAIGGFNAFLGEQQKNPDPAKITLVLFDHEYLPVYEAKDLPLADRLTPETFVPRGSTAMNDAIGRTLHEQGARIKVEGWAEKVIVCLVTDGHENSSKEFSQAAVQALVKEKEALGWSFVFLFAGISQAQAVSTTQGYGVNTNSLSNMAKSFRSGPAGQSVGYDTLSTSVGNLRGGGTAQVPDPAEQNKSP